MAINAGTILAYLDLDTSKFGSAIQLAEQQVSDFTGSGDGLSGALDGVGAAMTTVGNALTVGVSAPIVGAGVAVVKWAGDFQESANKVETIADTTVMSMDALNAGVLGISNQTGLAATSINEALYQTISATNDTANALGYTEIAAKAAKGGFTDTSTAIDGLTTVMNAYGLTGVEAMQSVSDQMLVAQNYGKTTFGELASTIGNVIPLAAQLNVGTDELFASIATLTKQGIGTSESVTGLKAALSGVIKPTDEASKMAASLGLDFSAAALESKGLAGFLADVKEKTGGNTEVMAQLFGSVEALNTIMALTSDQGMTDFMGGMAAMENSAGATDEAYATMVEGLNAGIAKLKNSFMNMGISLGNIIMPYAEKLVAWLQNGVEWINGLSDGVKKFIVAGAGIAAGLGPVLTIGGKLISAFSPVIPVLTLVGGAFALIYNHSERLQAAVASLKTNGLAAFEGLKKGVAAYREQTAAGATATQAMGTALTVAFGEETGQKLSGIIGKVMSLTRTVTDVTSGAAVFAGEFAGSLIDGQGAAQSLEDALQAAFDGNVPQRMRDIQQSVTDFAAEIKADYAEGGVLGVLSGFGSMAADALQGGWAEMRAAIGSTYETAKAYLIEQLPAVSEAIASGLQPLREKLVDSAKKGMEWLGDAYRSGAVQKKLGKLREVGEAIYDKFTEGKSTLIDKAGELLEGLGEALGSDEAKARLGNLTTIAASIAGNIASGMGSWKITAGKLIGGLVTQLTDNGFLQTALTGIGSITLSIAEGLAASADSMITAGTQLLTSLVDSMTRSGMIESLFTGAGELITRIGTILGNAAPKIASAAIELATALIDGLTGLDWPTIFTGAADVILAIAGVLGGVADSVVPAAVDLATALIDGIMGLDWPTIFTTAVDVITSIAGVLSGVAFHVADAATDIGAQLLDGLAGLDWPTLFTAAGTIVADIGNTLATNATQIAGAALDLGLALLDGLAGLDWAGIGTNLGTTARSLIDAIGAWMSRPEALDAIMEIGGKMAVGILYGMANGIDALVGSDIGLGEAILNLFGLNSEVQQTVADGIAESEKQSAQIQNYYNLYGKMVGAEQQLISSLSEGTAATIDQMASAIALSAYNMDAGLAQKYPEIAQQAKELWTSLVPLDTIDQVKALFYQNGYEISDEWAQSILDSKGTILSSYDAIGMSIGETINKTTTDVTGLLQNSATDWGKIFGQAIPDGATIGLENGMYKLRDATGKVIGMVSAVDAETAVTQGNTDTAQAGIDAASSTLTDGETTVGTAAQGVVDAISTPFESLPEDQKAQAAVMMEGINSAITAGTPAATTAIETAANAVTDKASEILNSAKGTTIGQDFVGGITTGVQNKQSALRTGLQTAAASGVGATSTVMSSSTGYGIGQNMVQGIINGVGSMAGALATKMRSLANSAVSAFRGALDMHSPSVLLMGDGALMAQSIGLGVTRGSEDAVRSMVALAGDMQDAWPGVTVDTAKVTGNPNDPSTWDDDTSGWSFHFYGDITVREEADLQKISAALADEFNDQRRGRGY